MLTLPVTLCVKSRTIFQCSSHMYFHQSVPKGTLEMWISVQNDGG